MKVLLDTNVLYSAFIQGSHRMSWLVLWICSNHNAFVTPAIANEILGKAADKAPSVLSAITGFLSSEDVHFLSEDIPSSFEQVKIRDVNDQRILDAALVHDVDIIISGDKDFHALALQRPRIMYPAEFISEFISE